MKFALLAAAAMFATPLMAQDTPPPADDQMMPADQAMPDAMAPQAPATDPAMAQPMQAPMAQSEPMVAPTDPAMAQAAETAGGYQPSAPAMMGTPAPGATVVFRPAPTPDQAFPPPPPMKSYPPCKRGQYDNCKNPGGR